MERAFRRWCRSASVKDEGEVGRVSNSAQLQEHFREAQVSSSTSCLLEAQNSPTTLSHWPKDLEEQPPGLSVSYAPCSQRCTRCIVMATIYGLERPACGYTGLCDHTCTFSLHYPLHEVKDCVCFAWYPHGRASVRHILETKATSTLLKINLKFF